MKSYHSNIIYAVFCFGFAFYMVRNALEGEGGTLTYVSAALVGAAGALFLAAYFKLKKQDQGESGDPDQKENR